MRFAEREIAFGGRLSMIQKRSFSERPLHLHFPLFRAFLAAAGRKSAPAMKIGYARVSTEDQQLDLQLDVLRKEGCAKVFEEKVTGTTNARPELQAALAALQEGDVLLVWRLDRLGRSLRHLIDIVQELETRRIGFQSLSDNIDTTSPGGRLLFHILGAIAEFECGLISERTKAGLQAARRQGKQLGRPRCMSAEQIEQARLLFEAERLSLTDGWMSGARRYGGHWRGTTVNAMSSACAIEY